MQTVVMIPLRLYIFPCLNVGFIFLFELHATLAACLQMERSGSYC